MNTTNPLILTNCTVYRIRYNQRPLTAVAGRDFASLTYRLTGSSRIRGEGCDLVSKPNTITYVPAGFSYRTDSPEGGEMIAMHFSAKENFAPTPITAPVPFPKSTENLFASAAQHCTAKGCDLVLMSMAYHILAEAQNIFTPSPPIPSRIRHCKQYLDENITDPTLRIRDLAERCAMSEVWFRREFEKYYGQSPLEYIKNKRLETSKLLLQTGLYSVTEVAFRSGFESSSYFSAEFRRREGLSPRDYKNRRE